MEETQIAIEKFFTNLKNNIKFPNNHIVKNSWNVYKPSYQSELFLSEEGRTIYAEAFQFDADDKVTEIPKVSDLALTIFVKNYKSGCIDKRIQYNDYEVFGENCDIELPLFNIAYLDNDIFWKRVVDKKGRNRFLYHQFCRETNANWHQLGVEVKLAELFETVEPEIWEYAHFENIIRKVSTLVEHLDIRQMIPLKEIERNKYDQSLKIKNVPVKDCHHGSLSVIGGLTNLKELSIKFGLETILRDYHRRYFEFSYLDIENLGKGLKQLKYLEVFRMTNSRMDDRKTKILVKSLEKLPLKILELSNCNLEDGSGISIGQLLIKNKNLVELELCGNSLRAKGLSGMGYGIQNFKGKLDYIGLARNPITEKGILAIGGGFCNSENVRKLNVNGCDLNSAGSYRVAQIIAFHDKLEEMDMSNLPLGESGGHKLIEVLTENYNVIKLNVRNCDLTESQQTKISLLIERNNYYNQNPCLKKSYFVEADELELNEWMNRTKHPLLLKLKSRTDSVDSFDVKTRKKRYDHKTTPDFITEAQTKIQSNSELLNVNFYDCFGPDSEIRAHKPEDDVIDKSEFIFNPNEYTEDEIFGSALIGKRININSIHYFKSTQ